MKNLVFVYGSLKRGLHNHGFLCDSKFIMETNTSDFYDMISFGSFPAVIKQSHWSQIGGEVYEVDDADLEALDILESNGIFYKRELIPVDGIQQPVWCYFLVDIRDYQSHERTNIEIDVKKVMHWRGAHK